LNRAQEAARNLEQDARKHVPDLIERIVVHSDRMEIAIRGGFLAGDDQAEAVWLTIPISLKRSGLAMRLIVNNTTQAREPDARLIALLAKGHDWLARLTSGRSNGVGSIAKDEGVTSSYVTRVIYLAFPRLTNLPRTMMRPFVKLTSSRIWSISSHPALRSEGVMNLVQISRSLKFLLSIVNAAGSCLSGIKVLVITI
jgi:hypothetical protein